MTGWALAELETGEVWMAGLHRDWQAIPVVGQALIERPQIDGRTSNDKDIITLAITTGRLVEAAVLRGWLVVETTIAGWKGSVPKDKHHPRIRRACTPVELARIEAGLSHFPKGEHHNAWDAVGLAKYPARGRL